MEENIFSPNVSFQFNFIFIEKLLKFSNYGSNLRNLKNVEVQW